MNPHVKQFQSYGMKLVPLHDETKKPKTKPKVKPKKKKQLCNAYAWQLPIQFSQIT